MRDSIIFYKSFFESIGELPSENALNIYNAVFRYAFCDEVPNLVGIEKAIFALIQPQIDANNKRYENGKKGGRPKKTETTEEENQNHRLLNQETNGFKDKKLMNNDNANDTENEKVNNNGKDISCAEPETDSVPAAVIELILNDKSIYPITQNDISGWEGLYPAVDIMQELRKMKGWCDSNPSKRKTRRGIKAFITNWLSKEQDKGGVKNKGASSTGTSTNDYAMSYQAWE